MDCRRHNCSSYLYSLTFFLLISSTYGYRDYIAAFEDFKCIQNSNLFKTLSCSLDKKTGIISAYAVIKEQVDSIFLNSAANMSQKNIGTKEVFNCRGMDVCEIVKEPVLNPVLKLLKMGLGKYLNMPDKCPIPANYVFKLSNLTLNAETLPTYLPECTYKSRGILFANHKAVLTVEMSGRITHRKPNAKGRRTWKKS